MLEELISEKSGLWMGVEKRVTEKELQVTLQLKGAPHYRLHWAVANRPSADWQLPSKTLWPDGSAPHGGQAVQSPFKPDSDGGRLVLRFSREDAPSFLVFDLYSPETNRWENNGGRDFWVALSEPRPSPATALASHLSGTVSPDPVPQECFPLDGGGELAAAVVRDDQAVRLTLVTDLEGPLLLHWGLQGRPRSRWEQPAQHLCPEATTEFDERSVRTPFDDREGLRWLTLTFPRDAEPAGLGLLLFQPDTGRWAKHRGADLFFKVSAVEPAVAPLSELMARIIEGEMGPHGWTLMHRFNLCHELTHEAGNNRQAWATLFVWLRYSAIRQLDWQRNFNTKPRELSHAQDRLTTRLAEAYAQLPEQRDLIRLILGTVGRGGDGQRIRDDILHIMHRHHIKEVGGTWMEQWHQKLHNNTTPDDIVICQAYLAFLYGYGDLGAYDRALGEGGVTRERLANFERAITRDPEWHPHLRDGLIHDFENYLQLLRSVHAGTDLNSAAQTADYLFEGEARGALEFVRHHFSHPGTDAVALIGKITEIRSQLAGRLSRDTHTGCVKDGMYLDLALEEALRTAIERQLQTKFGDGPLLMLIDLVLQNLRLVQAGSELDQCNLEWSRLPIEGRFSQDWCLRAKAVVDRLRRALEALTDDTYQCLQPLAEQLGREFDADQWTVTLFSEEIVRGRPVFVLSMLLHHLDPVLRKGAKLGDWQVISPSRALGEVRVVEELRSLQGQRFANSTVLVADRVHGDEEPPEGTCAVITSKSVDLVSHVAVRARNANLLFATCFDEQTFARLKELNGEQVELTVSSSGDVNFVRAASGVTAQVQARRRVLQAGKLPRPALRVLRRSQFDPSLVGGKSWRIREMAERMPDAFRTPRSAALPFGVFDAVLQDKANAASRTQLKLLLKEVQDSPEDRLAGVREGILGLALPSKLLDDLRSVLLSEGFTLPQELDVVGSRIKQVWASLWNDRAYFSRRTNGLSHGSVSMAVLIQEVVPAEYAFVIHTVNPATGNRDELYVEVVRGLGETLVGNYPGRAMSFVVNRKSLQPTVLAYPSKSIGLYGSGLIFRSDSNAEDLEGYAGAGLYDSVPLTPSREETVDYTQDRLVWDSAFQEMFVRGITTLGIEVEKSFGGPQDIEGAWAAGEFHVVQTRPQVGPE